MERIIVADYLECPMVRLDDLADPGPAEPFSRAFLALPAEREEIPGIQVCRKLFPVVRVVDDYFFPVFPDYEIQLRTLE